MLLQALQVALLVQKGVETHFSRVPIPLRPCLHSTRNANL